MLSTTLGQLLINDALPEDLRDYNRVMDKKGAKELLRQVAEQHPDKYREVSFRLATIGRRVSQQTGGYSFGARHMQKSVAGAKTRQRLMQQLQAVIDDDDLSDDQRQELIVKLTGREMKPQQEAVFKEALEQGNPLAMQVLSGARGSKMNLSSLLGSDMLYSDHHDRPIPIPVLHSYAEGLSPEEYWAGAYGARKGTIATKFATQDAGFFGKQLNQVAHRLVVMGDDYEDEEQLKITRGVPVDVDDMDNEGALLANDVGPYKRNTVLTPKILKHLTRLGKKRIIVRSAMVGGSPEGGVYARDVGVRERGTLPGRGEMVGLTAAQAISEPVSQGQLSAKHSGGVAGEEKAVFGFDYLNQLVQVPKRFKGGAAHARLDGTVQRIESAPAGGQYVTIDGEQHYVGRGYDLKVKKGDTIEAGDVLSEGIPNPAEVTRYKGVGEGRRYFVQAMRQAMRDAGMTAHRRNIELLSRGLINHVRLNQEYGSYVPDDVIPYSTLEHSYQPREGHQVAEPRRSVGKYLERPALHYTIGTKVKPSMLRDFEEFGIKDLTVHDDPPPFEPEMVRAMTSLQHDPDWMARMYGSGLKKGLLHAVQRGSTSDERGTSFVPSLARSVDFGRVPGGAIRAPEPGYRPSLAPEPEEATSMSKSDALSAPKQFKPVSTRKWFGGRFSLSPFGQKASMDKEAWTDDFVTANKPPKPKVPVAPAPAQPNGPSTATAPAVNPYQQAAAQHGPQRASTPALTPAPAPAPASAPSPTPTAAPSVPSGATPTVQQLAGENLDQEEPEKTPWTPYTPPTNPYAWGGDGGAGTNLLQTPFAVPLMRSMEQMMPGMGGVIGLGALANAKAFSTLTSGQAYNAMPQYGAAGLMAPGEESGSGQFYFAGRGGGYGGGGYGGGGYGGGGYGGGGYGGGGYGGGGYGGGGYEGGGYMSDSGGSGDAPATDEPLLALTDEQKRIEQLQTQDELSYPLRAYQANVLARNFPLLKAPLRYYSRIVNLPIQAATTAVSAPVRAVLKGVGALPGVKGTAFGQWSKGLNWVGDSMTAVPANEATAWERAMVKRRPWMRRLFGIKSEVPVAAELAEAGGVTKAAPAVAEAAAATKATPAVAGAAKVAPAVTEAAPAATEMAAAAKPVPATGAGATPGTPAPAAAPRPASTAARAGELTPSTAKLMTKAEASAVDAAEAGKMREAAQRLCGPGETVVQGTGKTGKVMTFIRGAGRTIKVVGKVAGVVGIVVSVAENLYGAGRLGYAAYEGGMKGLDEESAAMAERQRQEIEDIFTGKHGWFTLLSGAGLMFQPAKNVNLMAQTGVQGVGMARDVGRAAVGSQETGDKAMEAALASRDGGRIGRVMQEDNRQYKSLGDVHGPYELAAAAGEAVPEVMRTVAMQRAIEGNADQTVMRMLNHWDTAVHRANRRIREGGPGYTKAELEYIAKLQKYEGMSVGQIRRLMDSQSEDLWLGLGGNWLRASGSTYNPAVWNSHGLRKLDPSMSTLLKGGTDLFPTLGGIASCVQATLH